MRLLLLTLILALILILTYTNTKVNKKVNSLLVQCKSNLINDGKTFCCWVGPVNSLEEHHQSECQYITVMCNSIDCNKILPRYQMIEHAKECENRLIKCKLCTKVGPYSNRYHYYYYYYYFFIIIVIIIISLEKFTKTNAKIGF